MNTWNFMRLGGMVEQLPSIGQVRVFYQWLRIEQLDQWWHWLLLLLSCVLILSFVFYWYRRDSVEHARPVGWALLILRIAALTGLLLHFMQLDKRSEQRVVRESRVAVLADTSLSMTLPGTPSEIGLRSSLARIEEIQQLIGDSELLAQLASRHQVAVYRFDSQTRPSVIAALDRMSSGTQTDGDGTQLRGLASLETGRQLAVVTIALGAVSLLLVIVSLSAQILGWRNWKAGGWFLLSGSIVMLVSLATSAFAIFPNTAYTLSSLVTDTASLTSDAASPPLSGEEGSDTQQSVPEDWNDALQASGTETRIGDAIRAIVDREVGNPLAGIVVLTDGRSNAGVDAKQAAVVAKNARVPLYFVGVGSEKSPPNVRLVEVDVPKRLYPGDKFSLNALVGGTGYEGQSVVVQVASGAKEVDEQSLTLDQEMRIELPSDGSISSAHFELDPRSVGQWQYEVKVVAPTGDADLKDNVITSAVEVVDRKNRVLIIAGGPTREYQFVRNLLYRDRDVESHVFLQSGTSATSQESQELLSVFPSTRSELSQYDAILAFDADWTAVANKSVQVLEQWVAEQAGGFLIVAGSVEMPKWVSRSAQGTRAQFLRSLSPVVLDQRSSRFISGGRIESATAWPLLLTKDGEQTDFMRVDDDPQRSMAVWEAFSGVHSFHSVYELKPGAKALAFFNDPSTLRDGQLPVYLASQFYGAGRVVFLGGGEIWRMRRLGDHYFDRFYTKLVRWISQGRLLLDSDRGVLLVDRDEASLGEQVVVRAVLKTEQYEPLVQSEVVARLIDGNGNNTPLVLRPLVDGSQPGVYTGQFPVLVPGEYSIELQIGGITSNEILRASVRAKVPATEMQMAQRNDALMSQLATDSGGIYWRGAAAAAVEAPSGLYEVADAIESQDLVAFLPGTPDRNFQLRWLGWLMTWVASCLSLEWLARRIHRLA